MHGQTRTLRVLHLSADLPTPVLDQILTAAETALEDLGARRIWTTAEGHGVTVLAEIPRSAPSDAPSTAPVIDLRPHHLARTED